MPSVLPESREPMKQVCSIQPERTKKIQDEKRVHHLVTRAPPPRLSSLLSISHFLCQRRLAPPTLVRIRQPRSSKPRLLPATSSGETRKRGMIGARGRGLGEVDLVKELRSAERVAPTRITATHVQLLAPDLSRRVKLIA
ncbi:hypothetical protein PoB_001212600 [Plakobranchus ocellatus]|uniref:Histone H2A n=1 Tax=Plakobranchus ocellatus TaxID=259542 RepID=A0AAV3YQN1_9GAST|nr:hypothetical protein PoB_001212600 [Plakobranchus ocellatus]